MQPAASAYKVIPEMPMTPAGKADYRKLEEEVDVYKRQLWGYVRGLDFVFTELYNIFDNIPTAIVLILISYVRCV